MASRPNSKRDPRCRADPPGPARSVCRPRRAAAALALVLLLSGCAQVKQTIRDFADWLGAPADETVAESVVTTEAAPANPAPAPPPPPRPLTKDELQQVQKLLADLGYNPGPADGLIGPKTRNAVRNYRADRGYDEAEELTTKLLGQLRTDANGDQTQSAAAWTPRRLDSNTRPVYQPGDIYAYSDGRVETVVRIDDDKIFWAAQDGTGFVSYSDFVLPVLSWKTETRSGTRRMKLPDNSLWPLKIGNGIEFTAEAVLAPQSGTSNRIEWTESWKCVVDGTDTITVVSGEFATYRIACRNRRSTTEQPQVLVWYYAPSVRHYVRQDELDPGGAIKSSVELVGIRLGGEDWPPVARAGLGWALDDVMESRNAGDPLVWQSSGVDSEVTIIPTSSARNEGGTACRTYVMVETRADWERSYPGKACRATDGRWLIPGLV